MRGIVVGLVLSVVGCGSSSAPPPPAGPTPAEIDAKVRDEVARALAEERTKRDAEAKKEADKLAADGVRKMNAVAAAKPREWTFDEAWEEAKRIAAKRNEEEPAKTEKVLKAMGSSEENVARFYYKNYRDTLGELDISTQNSFTRYGLNEALRFQRRSNVFEGRPAFDLKACCEVLWRPTMSPGQIVDAAEEWNGSRFLEMNDSVRALRTRTKPKTTAGIQIIQSLPGGSDWLRAFE